MHSTKKHSLPALMRDILSAEDIKNLPLEERVKAATIVRLLREYEAKPGAKATAKKKSVDRTQRVVDTVVTSCGDVVVDKDGTKERLAPIASADAMNPNLNFKSTGFAFKDMSSGKIIPCRYKGDRGQLAELQTHFEEAHENAEAQVQELQVVTDELIEQAQTVLRTLETRMKMDCADKMTRGDCLNPLGQQCAFRRARFQDHFQAKDIKDANDKDLVPLGQDYSPRPSDVGQCSNLQSVKTMQELWTTQQAVEKLQAKLKVMEKAKEHYNAKFSLYLTINDVGIAESVNMDQVDGDAEDGAFGSLSWATALMNSFNKLTSAMKMTKETFQEKKNALEKLEKNAAEYVATFENVKAGDLACRIHPLDACASDDRCGVYDLKKKTWVRGAHSAAASRYHQCMALSAENILWSGDPSHPIELGLVRDHDKAAVVSSNAHAMEQPHRIAETARRFVHAINSVRAWTQGDTFKPLAAEMLPSPSLKESVNADVKDGGDAAAAADYTTVLAGGLEATENVAAELDIGDALAAPEIRRLVLRTAGERGAAVLQDPLFKRAIQAIHAFHVHIAQDMSLAAQKLRDAFDDFLKREDADLPNFLLMDIVDQFYAAQHTNETSVELSLRRSSSTPQRF